MALRKDQTDGRELNTDTEGLTPDQLQDKLADLEGKLSIYRKTLSDIYDLYDTRIEELSLIRNISDSLRTSLNLKEVCLELVEIVAHEVSLDTLDLILLDPASGEFRVKASFDTRADSGQYFDDEISRELSADKSQALSAAEKGTPIILPLAEEVFAEEVSLDEISRLILPLVARDLTIGLFYLTRADKGADAFGENEVRVLTIISDQAASTLANLRLLDDLAQANLMLKTSERQARETSVYLESLLEAANDVIFTLDTDGKITYVNGKVQQWGYDKDALIGATLASIAADPAFAERLLGLIKSAGSEALEMAVKSSALGVRDVLLGVSRLSPAIGGESNYLVLARDITDRKQLEKQLFHSEKLASVGILAAGVAHEVGNPLSAISGYTQILQSRAGQDETGEYLAAIADQTTRIQRIIENLLDFSRPSAGIRSQILINETVESVMSMLESQAAFKGLKVSLSLEENIPPVNMDRDHLAQIIINIALNAAQAMTEGGRLDISTAAAEDMAIIKIADSGPGIAEDIKDKIFDPFFTTKSSGQGTGLGLAICYRIAESYNAGISFESQPGQGATFTISLPVSEDIKE